VYQVGINKGSNLFSTHLIWYQICSAFCYVYSTKLQSELHHTIHTALSRFLIRSTEHMG